MCGLAAIAGYTGNAPPTNRDELLAVHDAMAEIVAKRRQALDRR
jgi:hypothetical protein